ncbi:TetR/AcrR family transcriptional regulator [Parasphingorhabdus sp.]|uniref:TetR/AcrR family transcriptional regulator n=1 Tax=Parasphingorhabdus sp. TaxID=2709688 RepID=UPI003A949B1F
MSKTAKKPARRTQTERRAESGERMLNAAEELFAEQGLMKTTLLDIGRRAGYSGGLATHRFGSKLGLVEALVERYKAIVKQKYLTADENGVVHPVVWRVFVERYFSRQEAENIGRKAMNVLMGESLGQLKEASDIFAEYNRWFTDIVEATIVESQRQGELNPKLNAHETAMGIVAGLRGVMLLWQSDPDYFQLPILAAVFKRSIEFTATDIAVEAES